MRFHSSPDCAYDAARSRRRRAKPRCRRPPVKAVVTKPGAIGNVGFAEVPEPTPDSDEALVSVKAFSLNRGEIRRAATQTAGTLIGWDVVGIVEAPARNGSGPAKGTRVVGFSRRLRG